MCEGWSKFDVVWFGEIGVDDIVVFRRQKQQQKGGRTGGKRRAFWDWAAGSPTIPMSYVINESLQAQASQGVVLYL